MVRLAEEIGMHTVLIPKVASGLCAFGQILSDVRYDQLTSLAMRLDAEHADLAQLNQALAELRQQGLANLREDGFGDQASSCHYTLEMRYGGQIHECSVELERHSLDRDGLAALIEAFHVRHQTLYSYSEPASPVELVNLECSVIGHLPRPPQPTLQGPAQPSAAVPEGERPMLFSADSEWQQTPVFNGNHLLPGQTVQGPCVIEEDTTNIVVPPGWQACLEPSATYRVTRGA
ncbi:Acetone carboxylase beta subunit [compost metagenome]